MMVGVGDCDSISDWGWGWLQESVMLTNILSVSYNELNTTAPNPRTRPSIDRYLNKHH